MQASEWKRSNFYFHSSICLTGCNDRVQEIKLEIIICKLESNQKQDLNHLFVIIHFLPPEKATRGHAARP